MTSIINPYKKYLISNDNEIYNYRDCYELMDNPYGVKKVTINIDSNGETWNKIIEIGDGFPKNYDYFPIYNDNDRGIFVWYMFNNDNLVVELQSSLNRYLNITYRYKRNSYYEMNTNSKFCHRLRDHG